MSLSVSRLIIIFKLKKVTYFSNIFDDSNYIIFLFVLVLFWLLNMYKCFACMCVCASHMCLDLWRSEEVSGSSTSGVTSCCESRCGRCEVNLGPLEKQQAFLFNEQSPQPPKNLCELLTLIPQPTDVLFMATPPIFVI